MELFNSNGGHDSDRHDSDVTLIRPSLLSDLETSTVDIGQTDSNSSQQENDSSEDSPLITSRVVIDKNQDYTYIELDFHESIKQILNYYRQELEQESKTQLDCTGLLIIRLVDFIRSKYSLDEENMKDLETLLHEISKLQNEKSNQEKEKCQRLQNDIIRLEKFIIDSTNEYQSNCNINKTNVEPKKDSDFTVNMEEWLQLEEETKQIKEIIEYQRKQIDELVTLLPNEETVENETHPTDTYSNLPSIQQILASLGKKCCLCNYEYPTTFTDTEIHNHATECLSTFCSENRDDSFGFIHMNCPFCNKSPTNADSDDLHHMAVCCSQLNFFVQITTK